MPKTANFYADRVKVRLISTVRHFTHRFVNHSAILAASPSWRNFFL